VVEGDFGPVTMTVDRAFHGVLRVHIRGEGGHADAALRRWRYNVALARDAGLRKILVVLELSGPVISEPAMAGMISKVADMNLSDFRVAIVQKRGRYMSEAVPAGTGAVAALLGLAAEVVREACREAGSAGVVQAANFNSPGQVVIAGEKAAVERAIEIAKTKGCKKAVPLPVSVPVHTPLMQKAADRLAADLASIAWTDLRMPLINNAEAKPIVKAGDIQASLVRQLPSSVLWEDSVKAMAATGVKTFVEIGPGTVLTGLIRRIVPDATTLNVNDPKSLEATRAALGL